MSFFSHNRTKTSPQPFQPSQSSRPSQPLSHEPQVEPSAISKSKRLAPLRKHLNKKQRVSSPVSPRLDIFNAGICLGLGVFSTSPLDMTFGTDVDGPVPEAAPASAPAPSLTPTPAPTPAEHATSPDLAELVQQYQSKREHVEAKEAELAFDHACRSNATRAEQLADAVLLRLKEHDKDVVFGTAEGHRGYGNQMHAAFAGDHFLSNVSLIKDTHVLRAARHMPKGAHLHIHFNACLEPHVLLGLARDMDRMFITSDLPLTLSDDATLDPATDRTHNFFLCEIQFSILAPEKELPGDLFSADYQPRQTMRFGDFLARFPADAMHMSAMDWLVSKLVFSDKEAYDIPQTSHGAWERFNGRTRMMKGLFNYVSVYRKYTELFLQDLLDDNIQYAEIRPNFMTTNQLWNDDGTGQLDNVGIVELIVTACEDFKKRHPHRNFDGIKIIYCTPRSFPRDKVRAALVECIAFKQRWPAYIAGFDLVGEEAKGFPLKHFVPEFLEFQQACRAAGLDIPFLFHCGETLEMGTDVDGNLVDALLLGSKRIGHGFALPRHPYVMRQMKQRQVCVEVCPISNEILGLTPRIGGHAVYNLLAQNVPCTVSSDNGTLFQSTLSHDFYQILVGKADMGLYGWRQLAEWSLLHTCLEPAKLADARRRWLDAWRDYVVWLLRTYDDANPETTAVLELIAQDKSLAARALPE